MAAAFLKSPLAAAPLIVLNTAIEAISSTNSIVIAPKATLSFSESTTDSATMAAVRIAIAPAIFNRVPA